MNWKTLVISMALAIVGTACGGDAPVPVESTRTYIITSSDAPSSSTDAPGFDLDGVVSDPLGGGGSMTGTACIDDAQDLVSSATGAIGVDNQFSANVVSLLEAAAMDTVANLLHEQIAEGNFLLMMDVTSNGIINDDTVSVHLYLGALASPTMCDNAAMTCPAGATCPAAAAAGMEMACGPVLDASGNIVAGQDFVQAMDLATVSGRITGGNLLVETDTLGITVVVGGNTVTLDINQARIGGRLSETGISGGEIGGSILVTDIVALAAMFGATTIDETTIRSIAEPDVDDDGDMMCEGISIGIGYVATTANP